MMLIFKKIFLATAGIFFLSLGGCATLGTSQEEPGTAPAAATETAQPKEEITRPFERETLYDLLVAEFAGKRNRADVALGKYLKQAHKTRDPVVTARATRIARYLGAHQAALDSAMLWMEIEPDNLEAKEVAATELIRFGQMDRAINLLEELLAANAEVNFEFLLRGLQGADEDRRAHVLNRLNKLIETHPDNAQLWFTKGAIEQIEKRWESALNSFSKALEVNPQYTNAILAKAKQLMALGRDQEALKFTRQATRDYPGNKRIGITYARMLISAQKLVEAQGEFGRLAARYPNDPDLILSLALISWENKMTDTAKAQLNRLLDMHQRENEAHTYLGRIAASEKDFESAIEHFTKVHRGPHYAQARIQLALIYAEIGEHVKAHNVLNIAREEMPEHEEQFYLAESEILSKQGKTREAIELLTSALEAHPGDTGILYTRAMLLEQLDEYERMEADLRSILSQDPDNTAALNALGYTFADRNERLDEAANLIEKAYALDPDDPAIIDSMGWIKYRLGDTEAALSYLRRAYEAFQDQEIAAHLGEVLWVIGHREEAARVWTEALKENPDSEILKRVMDRFISP
ncbi:MAG: tetratricopeptide repeat protein [Ketobacteraceae bacterium]|nr:tetratricopeptide repeat protein [Ketobacteraceae bacterium]